MSLRVYLHVQPRYIVCPRWPCGENMAKTSSTCAQILYMQRPLKHVWEIMIITTSQLYLLPLGFIVDLISRYMNSTFWVEKYVPMYDVMVPHVNFPLPKLLTAYTHVPIWKPTHVGLHNMWILISPYMCCQNESENRHKVETTTWFRIFLKAWDSMPQMNMVWAWESRVSFEYTYKITL